MIKKLMKLRINTLNKSKRLSKKTLQLIDRRPLRSFFLALLVVFLLIVAGNLLPKAKQDTTKPQVIKNVSVYKIGTAPKVTVQAQIKKSGVVQITSQVAGVVNYISASEGAKISRGTQLFSIASNYYGGNAASLQRQIAQTQHDNLLATFQLQKDAIQRQKDQANKTFDNSDQLRDIISKSNDDTNSLINLNDQILQSIQSALDTTPATDSATLRSLNLLKSQLMSGNNQAKSALRNSQYNGDADKPGFELEKITKDIALKKLDVQEKQLDMSKEISSLQLAVARVNEAMYYPASPFSGVVERVFVKQFDFVSPGIPLMIISQVVEEDPISAVAFVSKDIAQLVSQLEMSILHIGNEKIEAIPSYVSSEAVSGSLYAVYYSVPDKYNKALTDGGYISIEIPVGYPDSIASTPFVPIDAVYQTRSRAYLFVSENGKAVSREVVLGQIFGRFVEVESGLQSSDQVIIDRNIIDGDIVSVY